MRRTRHLASTAEPLSTINTTPMIDILLVLLIMMIMSLPPPSHQVPIDLPTVGGSEGVPPPVHLLSIDARGGLAWDAAPMPHAALRAKLASFVADPAKPVLHLQTDAAAPYERFDATLAAVKAAGVKQIGFVGNPPGF